MKNRFFHLQALILALGLISGSLSSPCRAAAAPSPEKVVVAYVTSWSSDKVDPSVVTHINYSFAHVGDKFNEVRIDNPDRLREIVALKKEAPSLKVLLSVGGWGSGRFSEMAASKKNRPAFAHSCKKAVDEYGLDGIDIDWEYPGSDMAGISSSPSDKENFTLLMKDLREALGEDKLLTLASSATAQYIDFPAIMPYVDFVNIMAYDMANAPRHHSALRSGTVSGDLTVDEATQRHLLAGVPKEKLVLGMPLYGRGKGERPGSFFQDPKSDRFIPKKGYSRRWDTSSKVPYLVDSVGNMVYGYEDVRSIKVKCEYIKEQGLLGGMYWAWGSDPRSMALEKEISFSLRGKPFRKDGYAGAKPRFKALILWDSRAEEAHVQFDRQGLRFFHKLGYGEGWLMDTTQTLSGYTLEKLKEYSVIIALNASPGPRERRVFEQYMEEGGGWIGFHASGYHDASTGWDWFDSFLGCGLFKCNNWPPQPALLEVETQDHPVTQNLPKEFVAAPSEWYQWQRNIRENPDIEVLLSLSPKNYPIGIKDVVYGDDFPVVWTNHRYRMIYLNMGHGDEGYIDAVQQLLFVNALRWIVSMDPSGDPFNR